jgi:hypothetical protein
VCSSVGRESGEREFFFFFSVVAENEKKNEKKTHLIPVPERAVATDAGAVAVSGIVVEVAAAAAAPGPVPGDGDRVDDDVGDEQAVVPAAAVWVGPAFFLSRRKK